jgi:FixJ family two-component response regulator
MHQAGKSHHAARHRETGIRSEPLADYRPDLPGQNAGNTVYLLDNDEASRCATSDLLRSVDIEVEAFATATEFLATPLTDAPSCLLTDVRLRGSSGLAIQAELKTRRSTMPVVFLTDSCDATISVKAMKAGAFDFLTRPCRDQQLLDIIELALNSHKKRLLLSDSIARNSQRYLALTERQKEVIGRAAHGLSNSQIAAELGLSPVTVKIYKREAMRTIGCGSTAGLVKMAIEIGLVEAKHIELIYWSGWLKNRYTRPYGVA